MCLREKIGPDPRNFNQRVSLGRNDLLIRTFLTRHEIAEILDSEYSFSVTAKGLEMALYRTRQNRKMYCTIRMIRVARRVQRKVYCTIHNRLSLKCRKVKSRESRHY